MCAITPQNKYLQITSFYNSAQIILFCGLIEQLLVGLALDIRGHPGQLKPVKELIISGSFHWTEYEKKSFIETQAV